MEQTSESFRPSPPACVGGGGRGESTLKIRQRKRWQCLRCTKHRRHWLGKLLLHELCLLLPHVTSPARCSSRSTQQPGEPCWVITAATNPLKLRGKGTGLPRNMQPTEIKVGSGRNPHSADVPREATRSAVSLVLVSKVTEHSSDSCWGIV